jgi:hypothetical protein
MARDCGTSESCIRKRWVIQNAFEDHIDYIYKCGTNYNKKLLQNAWEDIFPESDFNIINNLGNKIITSTYIPPEDVWAETSDDTKELEKRPLKNPSPLRILQILDTHKRPRLSPDSLEDFTEDRQKI